MPHPCPVEGCKCSAGDGKLVCYNCWRRLPKALQRRLYAAWNDGSPTDDYEDAVEATLNHLDFKPADGVRAER